MTDGNGIAEALLGLDGFRVLEVTENPDEVVIKIETVVATSGCGSCGSWAESQDRVPVDIRDLAASGVPPGCVGSSADGVVATATATPRRGPSTPPTSTPPPC
jgi:hypothetical protein